VFSKADIRICRGFGVKPSCGQRVRMTKTEAGAPFPVNVAPDLNGNTAVWRDVAGTLWSRRVTKDRPLESHEKLMMPHVATCKPPARRTTPPRPPRPPKARPADAASFYAVLGVERGAGQDDIKRAYRRLARQLHPDVNPGAESAERFKKVTEAYDILSDSSKRKMYDLTGRAPRPGR
jgi:hypothetical protein